MATISQKPFKVGIYAVPGFALASYASTVEPLRAANLLSTQQLYQIIHFDDGTPSESSGGAILPAQARVGETPDLDLFLVIAGGDPSAFHNPRLMQWLARMSRSCPQIGGVSGGPFILARAGLMAGRRMTVHWEHAAALAELDPSLAIERRLFVIDRDRVTCGGGTAPLDMMYALIERHQGPALARHVADWFLHTSIREPASPQRGSATERYGTHAAPLLLAVSAMETALAHPYRASQLADIARVSFRQLNRLSQRDFGCGLMQFYRRIRLDAARQMVENSALSMTEIALATGFSGSSHFSRQFADRFGHPPSKFRANG